MFSFGTIKLNTAFYGAVTIVRERNGSTALLVESMNQVQDAYEAQLDNKEYVKKMRFAGILKNVIHKKLPLRIFNAYMAHES